LKDRQEVVAVRKIFSQMVGFASVSYRSGCVEENATIERR